MKEEKNLTDLAIMTSYVAEILHDYNHDNISRNTNGDKLTEKEKYVYLHLKGIYDILAKDHINAKEKKLWD